MVSEEKRQCSIPRTVPGISFIQAIKLTKGFSSSSNLIESMEKVLEVHD